jgi:predicted phage terminase large subunit-like protein
MPSRSTSAPNKDLEALYKAVNKISKKTGPVFETDENYWESLTPAQYLKALRDAEESFLGFVKLIHPRWDIPDFQLQMIDILDRLEKGTLVHPVTGKPCSKAMFNQPPRHAKSTYATELFPAYYHLRNATRYSMTASYSSDLAIGFGKSVRDIIELPIVKQAFPKIGIDPKDRSKEEWGLVDESGSPTGGKYYAVGLGGVTTGRPANLLIWDDPIKTKEEADSPTIRNKTWDFIQYSLQTRLQPNFVMRKDEKGEMAKISEAPIEIAILTRWNVDDPGGRIQETPDWKDGLWYHIEFPAIIDIDTPNERALWEERFPLEDLKRIRRQEEARFQALYQQRPFIKGGSTIKSRWWRFTKELPRKEDIVTLIAGVDTAFKAEENNDPTSITFASLGIDGNYYIHDVVEKRVEYPELKRLIITLNGMWRPKGFRGFYVEDRASGQSLVQDLRRSSGGVSIIPHRMLGDKAIKAKSVSPLIEGGLVHLLEDASWVDDFMKEFEQFTGDSKKKEKDNKVDSTVIALDVLSRMSTPQTTGGSAGFVQPGRSLNEMLSSKNVSFRGFGE